MTSKTIEPLRSTTILLVDDDPDCRMLMRDALEQGRLHNQVFEVADGREALEFLQRRGDYADVPRPELIYMDIEMPHMNGQETLRQIKSDPRLREIPIVMMSGLDDDEQQRMAALNGANSYTVKPNDPVRFLQTVLQMTKYWLCVHRMPEPNQD